MTWRWIDQRLLVLLHDESLAMHGGASGLRDPGLLESALSRPLDQALCGQPDVAALAVSYASGLAHNDPFVDGNKRTALLSMGLFLGLNGCRLTASQAEATVAMWGLACGDVDEAIFAAWLRERIASR